MCSRFININFFKKMIYWPFVFMFLLYFVVMIGTAVFIYRFRSTIDEMHGMMIGMTFGMLAGLVTATLYVLPTGNFLVGIIIGSLIGLIVGIPFGKLGGHLGIMEGIMAGPMGGMMGAMLGQMIRPFDIEVFMLFFTFIFLITTGGIAYASICKASCCDPNKSNLSPISSKFIIGWIFIFLFLLIANWVLPLTITGNEPESKETVKVSETSLPAWMIALNKEERQETKIVGNNQEITINIGADKYSPNVIIAKKGIPLIINLVALPDSGCGREVIFPDFETDQIVPKNGQATIKINPTTVGEFGFRCSMDMVRGKLIIVE